MKTIYRIARLELSTLFYSPIAWLVLIIFIFQSGMDFADLLQNNIRYHELGMDLDMVTQSIFTRNEGLFPSVQMNLYLYLPLLTMGLISRETSSGSIKLLLSSPVTIGEIVLGKFLAMMAYGALMIGILILFVIAGHFSIEAMDLKMLISGLSGIYLLICAYSAIGLFMSSLTSYQVVAAISTLAVFALLNFIGEVGQNFDFIRDITWWLSISGRCGQFVDGIISSQDVLYFLLVIMLFLALTYLKLQGGREIRSVLSKTLRYAGVLIIVVMVGYFSSRPAWMAYYDMTATRTGTLTENSQQVVRKILSPLTIHTYVNLLDQEHYWGMPHERNRDMKRFEQYIRFKPGIRMDYTYYYDSTHNEHLYKSNPGLTNEQLARKVARAENFNFKKVLTPGQIRKIIDLAPEERRFVRQLEAGGRKTFLRIYQDNFRHPFEREITASLKRLVTNPPVIAFLSGNNERDVEKMGDKDYRLITQYPAFRYSLINQGFDIINISAGSGEIPDSIAVLVIADPKSAFSPMAQAQIDRFIARGGNLLIAGEPGRQTILNPFIRQFGVQLMDGMMIQQSKDYSPNLVFGHLSPASAGFSGGFEKIWKDSGQVSFAGAVGLAFEKNDYYTAHPLLFTDSNTTWNKLGVFSMDTGKVIYNPEQGDEKRSCTLAAAVTRERKGRQQRIFIMGDADIFSTAELGRINAITKNFDFSTELFKWFSYGEFPIDTDRPKTYDNNIMISQEGTDLVRVIFLGIIQVFLIIFASVLLLRRKRR